MTSETKAPATSSSTNTARPSVVLVTVVMWFSVAIGAGA
jgi:hypothetical protein